jgi:hypothetical protein
LFQARLNDESKTSFGGKDSNDASKIPTCWIDRDMMPQNFFVTAQVLYKHPVFENDVAGGHATKKHESRREGKQRIAKEKYDRFASCENIKERANNKKQKTALTLALARGEQQAASVDAQMECNNLMQRNQNLEILKNLGSGVFDNIPGITDDDRKEMAQALFQQLVPSKEDSSKGTLSSAFQKRVTEIDCDSYSEPEVEVVAVVVPSPTVSPRASSPASTIGSTIGTTIGSVIGIGSAAPTPDSTEARDKEEDEDDRSSKSADSESESDGDGSSQEDDG